jgi:alpha-L-fucosidase 2
MLVMSNNLLLWYKQPAAAWTEALPIGNGRLGGMVFGGVERERIALNEDTLWGGGPYDSNHEGAVDALPAIRSLVENGQFAEAQAKISERFMATPLRQMPYQTLGDMWLTHKASTSEVSAYRRELNLETAIATTQYEQGGVVFIREVFISPIAQVMVVRLTASQPGQITVNIGFKSPHEADVSVRKDATILLYGVNTAAEGVAGALVFQARARVRAEGAEPVGEGDEIRVENANAVTIFLAMATSFKAYDNCHGDPDDITRKQVTAAWRVPYDVLKANHIAEHQRLFSRVTLDLGTTEIAQLPTDERIKRTSKKDDPALFALYFHYARYLLICSSRSGTQPANLQGIWNDQVQPPWGSKYTININTEMNYWPAEMSNLSECVEPLIKMVEEVAKRGEKTAQVHWGARGWVVHHNTDIWRATAPIDGPQWGMWPCGGAWLCKHLWEHYEYGGDAKYLLRIYHLFKGACRFFQDVLVVDKKTGYLVTNPSISPENAHHKNAAVCAGPTMDAQIIRDLFALTEKTAKILGKDLSLQQQLQLLSSKLPPNQVGKQGHLQEWLEDWDGSAPEPQHRHVSHLFGLFPSQQISPRHSPELAEACRKTLTTRGDFTTGWAIAWRINLWARLRDSERTYKILELLLEPSRTYPNLFDAHPPFQIDGNFGGANGILEMLVQQDEISGEIELLPCLPSAWQAGSVNGLRLKGGFLLSMAWEGGRLTQTTITQNWGKSQPWLGKTCVLRYKDTTRPVSLQREKSVTVSWA